MAARRDEAKWALAVRRYLEGATSYDIAADLGYSPGHVQRILHRSGVQLRQTGLSPATRQQAVELYRSGKSLADVARSLGISYTSARNSVRAGGVPLRAIGGTPTDSALTARAVELYLAGANGLAVAAALGISRSVVYRALKDAGVPARRPTGRPRCRR